MKKAWRLKASYGSQYVVLYAEDGRELDIYKESTCMGMIAPRAFSFMEYNQGIPQKIAETLNNGLKKYGVYTDFIERSHDNV